MPCMMEHKQHGRHPAADHEIEALIKAGWYRLGVPLKTEGDKHLELVKEAIIENFPKIDKRSKAYRDALKDGRRVMQ